MKNNDLGSIVSDWGGFEELVASLHRTGDVTVTRNVTILGRSGAPRQIDVLVTHRKGLYEHRIVVECKYWRNRVKRLHVDALATTVRDVGADRGVLFSVKGFQSGAVTQAEHEGISLMRVRDPSAEEWGRPGRHIEFYIQCVQPTIRDIKFVEPRLLAESTGVQPRAPTFDLRFGKDRPESHHPTIDRAGAPLRSIEERILDTVGQLVGRPLPPHFVFNGGTDCKLFFGTHVKAEPKEGAFIMPVPDGLFLARRVDFFLGIALLQKRMKHDRARDFLFALAVEDCVTGAVTAASRRPEDSVTSLARFSPSVSDCKHSPPLVNGSILRVTVKGFFPASDLEGATIHGLPEAPAG